MTVTHRHSGRKEHPQPPVLRPRTRRQHRRAVREHVESEELGAGSIGHARLLVRGNRPAGRAHRVDRLREGSHFGACLEPSTLPRYHPPLASCRGACLLPPLKPESPKQAKRRVAAKKGPPAAKKAKGRLVTTNPTTEQRARISTRRAFESDPTSSSAHLHNWLNGVVCASREPPEVPPPDLAARSLLPNAESDTCNASAMDNSATSLASRSIAWAVDMAVSKSRHVAPSSTPALGGLQSVRIVLCGNTSSTR